MKNTLLIVLVTALVSVSATLLFTFAVGAAAPPATQPNRKIPAAEPAAAQAIKDSPRHAEWVEIELPAATPAGAAGSATPAPAPTKVKTWVVYPERKEKAPVILVIFEIFGMTDWVRGVADQFAADGFIAVAPDLLSGMIPAGGDARGAIGQLSVDEQTKRLNAVRDWAIKLPSANGKTGSVGFCWGGAASFNYAARQPGLNAAAVYYGSPVTDRDLLSKITCPVMGFYGGNDARITSTVPGTVTLMAELQKTFTQHTYEGAGHGFLRQQTGQNGANQRAADAAWPATVEFFRKNLETPVK